LAIYLCILILARYKIENNRSSILAGNGGGGELWSPLGFLFNGYWGGLFPGKVASVLSRTLVSI